MIPPPAAPCGKNRANTLSNGKHTIQQLTYYPITDAWVTQPERPQGAKDEVKRPEGPPPRSRGPEGPQTSSIQYSFSWMHFLKDDQTPGTHNSCCCSPYFSSSFFTEYCVMRWIGSSKSRYIVGQGIFLWGRATENSPGGQGGASVKIRRAGLGKKNSKPSDPICSKFVNCFWENFNASWCFDQGKHDEKRCQIWILESAVSFALSPLAMSISAGHGRAGKGLLLGGAGQPVFQRVRVGRGRVNIPANNNKLDYNLYYIFDL